MPICDSSCVGANYSNIQQPYAACYRSPRCNLLSPNWNYDPYRKHFCQKFGQHAPDSCQENVDKCNNIHGALQSLDRFSLPPMYRRGGCDPKFRCRANQSQYPNKPVFQCEMKEQCPGIPQLPASYRPNPKPPGDAICGLCVKPEELEARCQKSCSNKNEEIGEEDADGVNDLPFVVYPLWTNDCSSEKRPPKPSGVARCLHPSDFRSLRTMSQSEYIDFFKTKSPEDIALYQSKLAVDTRRPPVCIPSKDPNEELDPTRPIFLNAKMLKWNQRGKNSSTWPSISVSVPGPIRIG